MPERPFELKMILQHSSTFFRNVLQHSNRNSLTPSMRRLSWISHSSSASRHCPPRFCGFFVPRAPFQDQRRWNSSFIRQVMDQVKKELETNEQLRKSVKEFRESGVPEPPSNIKQHLEQSSEKVKRMSQKVVDSVGSMYSATTHVIGNMKERAELAHQGYQKIKDSSPVLKSISSATTYAVNATKSTLGKAVDCAGKLLEFFRDEKAEEAKKRAEKWRTEMERKRETSDHIPEEPSSPYVCSQTVRCYISISLFSTEEATYALIIAQDSAWDRFGTKLRDMPFLHNFFGMLCLPSPIYLSRFRKSYDWQITRGERTSSSTTRNEST